LKNFPALENYPITKLLNYQILVMLILSIDTSGKSGGITLAEGEKNSFRLLSSAPIAGGTFSAQLVPTLASLLEKHRLAATDIAGFVVVSGPGSFTGLRVGLSAIKGLAEILKKPIATVSLPEALAITSGEQGKVAAALDAGRQEIFFGIYDVNGSGASAAQEQLLSNDEFTKAIADKRGRPLVTSDQTVAELAESVGVQARKISRPGSESVAQIGLHKLFAGETVGVEELDANYLRRSDAEIFHRVIASPGHRVIGKPKGSK